MPGILERYRSFYNLPDDYPIVSLHEGNTPLVPAPALSQWLFEQTGVRGLRIFLKLEGANPTGSFKDRGMTYAVSQAKKDGASVIICASTGNTSASAAAYGARCGLQTIILLPAGKVALGKLSQTILYGCKIIEIDGNFDRALDLVRQLGESGQATIVNSINPYRIEGQKSGAFEICDALGRAPDYHFIPVGNAGNITAYWRGYCQYADAGRIDALPRMVGYEAEGSAAIVKNCVIEHPETFATAIRIGNPASWDGAVAARDESGGWIDMVDDGEIAWAYHFLASREGIFCEPASAASVAGLIRACREERIDEHATVACVLTGNGLKDPDSAIRLGEAQRVQLPADMDAILGFLRDGAAGKAIAHGHHGQQAPQADHAHHGCSEGCHHGHAQP